MKLLFFLAFALGQVFPCNTVGTVSGVSSCGNATFATFPLGGSMFTILSQNSVYDARSNSTIVISDVQVVGGYQVYGFVVDSNNQVSVNSFFTASGILPNKPHSKAVLGSDLLVAYEEHTPGNTNIIHLVWFDTNLTEVSNQDVVCILSLGGFSCPALGTFPPNTAEVHNPALTWDSTNTRYVLVFELVVDPAVGSQIALIAFDGLHSRAMPDVDANGVIIVGALQNRDAGDAIAAYNPAIAFSSIGNVLMLTCSAPYTSTSLSIVAIFLAPNAYYLVSQPRCIGCTGVDESVPRILFSSSSASFIVTFLADSRGDNLDSTLYIVQGIYPTFSSFTAPARISNGAFTSNVALSFYPNVGFFVSWNERCVGGATTQTWGLYAPLIGNMYASYIGESNASMLATSVYRAGVVSVFQLTLASYSLVTSQFCSGCLVQSNQDAIERANALTCPCVPYANRLLCQQASACGLNTFIDNCGTNRSVDCGTCAYGTCVNNACSCNGMNDTALCSMYNASCGTLVQFDDCGVMRSVSCGTCSGGLQCAETTSLVPNVLSGQNAFCYMPLTCDASVGDPGSYGVCGPQSYFSVAGVDIADSGSVAWSEIGGFFVMTYATIDTLGRSTVYSVKLDDIGSPIGTPVVLYSAGYPSRYPQIVYNQEDDTFLVAFEAGPTLVDTAVVLILIDANGNAIDTLLYGADVLAYNGRPSVAWSVGNRWGIVWQDASTGVARISFVSIPASPSSLLYQSPRSVFNNALPLGAPNIATSLTHGFFVACTIDYGSDRDVLFIQLDVYGNPVPFVNYWGFAFGLPYLQYGVCTGSGSFCTLNYDDANPVIAVGTLADPWVVLVWEVNSSPNAANFRSDIAFVLINVATAPANVQDYGIFTQTFTSSNVAYGVQLAYSPYAVLNGTALSSGTFTVAWSESCPNATTGSSAYALNVFPSAFQADSIMQLHQSTSGKSYTTLAYSYALNEFLYTWLETSTTTVRLWSQNLCMNCSIANATFANEVCACVDPTVNQSTACVLQTCGVATKLDVCGNVQTFQCGSCGTGQQCGLVNAPVIECCTVADATVLCNQTGTSLCGNQTLYDDCSQTFVTVACPACPTWTWTWTPWTPWPTATPPTWCVPYDDQTLCSQLVGACGPLDTRDNCGFARSIVCGDRDAAVQCPCGSGRDACLESSGCSGADLACVEGATVSGGIVALIVILLLVFLLAVALIVFLLLKRRKGQTTTTIEVAHYEEEPDVEESAEAGGAVVLPESEYETSVGDEPSEPDEAEPETESGEDMIRTDSE